MFSALSDLLFALTLISHDTVSFYGRLAPRYNRIHRRWLRAGGAETVAAVQGCLAAELRPGARVLDAGCGTGSLARWIIEQEPCARITLLDAAQAMLDHSAAIPARRVRGDLLELPFPHAAFDIVVCSWALETVDNLPLAIAELKRVLAPGGLLCCCYLPGAGVRDVRANVSLGYQITERWGVNASATVVQLQQDAKASPIVRDRTMAIGVLGTAYRF